MTRSLAYRTAVSAVWPTRSLAHTRNDAAWWVAREPLTGELEEEVVGPRGEAADLHGGGVDLRQVQAVDGEGDVVLAGVDRTVGEDRQEAVRLGDAQDLGEQRLLEAGHARAVGVLDEPGEAVLDGRGLGSTDEVLDGPADAVSGVVLAEALPGPVEHRHVAGVGADRGGGEVLELLRLARGEPLGREHLPVAGPGLVDLGALCRVGLEELLLQPGHPGHQGGIDHRGRGEAAPGHLERRPGEGGGRRGGDRRPRVAALAAPQDPRAVGRRSLEVDVVVGEALEARDDGDVAILSEGTSRRPGRRLADAVGIVPMYH